MDSMQIHKANVLYFEITIICENNNKNNVDIYIYM